MTPIFRYHAIRAQLARMHLVLSGGVKILIFGMATACGLIGLLLAFGGVSAGWFILSCGVPPLTLLIWDKRHLARLPVANGDGVHDMIEVDLLARLPKTLDRRSLAEALAENQSVQFMMVRAGISPATLSEQLGDEQIAAAWNDALAIARENPDHPVRGSMWFAMLIRHDAQLQQLLPHVQLDQDAVESVMHWYSHLDHLIIRTKQPRLTGGIARDWTFGYTPVLERFAVNMTAQSAFSEVPGRENVLDFMIQTFGSGGRQNVALIGASGSGKTSIVQAFAQQLLAADAPIPENLKFRQVWSLDSAALISAAAGRGEIENLLNSLLVEVYKAKNIILCLDNAQLFFEDGVGSVDVSNLLQPVIENDSVRIILTMNDQKFLEISQRNPSLAQSMNRMILEPLTRDQSITALQNGVILLEHRRGVRYMYQSLVEAYRLSERYMYDIVQPGKGIRLLESAGQYAENGVLVTAASVQQAIEQTQGVKVGGSVSSGEERERLLNLESLIHERMINQTRAVTVVSDALRRARAGVRNEGRPIGTFLFLGPTGGGKTELSKALGEVYFGGEDNLIRLDMNEFVGPDDVRRLIEDGANDPNSLCAQVMKQPFSVVLLDELEKAHDAVLTTLLQLLDEGILRDIKGREVSFRDAIVIATSNAGADLIRQHIEAGEELEQFEEQFTNQLISSGQFRPEFLNRFDEIVLFRPLKPEELKQVIDLMMNGVNKSLANQQITVEIDDQLKDWLVINGNDPRLGARPMRRMVQRVVENTMAKRMLAGDIQPGHAVVLTIADIPAEMVSQQTAQPAIAQPAPQPEDYPPTTPIPPSPTGQ